MQLTATGAAAMTLNVTGNTIRNWATNNGIDITSGDGVNGSPNVNLTITGNTLHLDSPTVNQLHGISANMGTTSTGGAVNACVDIGGTGLQNNVTGSIGSGGGLRFASGNAMHRTFVCPASVVPTIMTVPAHLPQSPTL